MKTLILCVDRDDDLGQKAGVETPVLGRRRVLEAAGRLGIADPEDSDTNALYAAVRLYDKELAHSRGGRRTFEVAAIAGDKVVGLRSDRVLAKELEEVLQASEADEVVLVSDGAEDEQVIPILTSRTKVAHVHRSIVKQAPRLEGFYHVLTRMLDDEKLAKRYVLPLGLIFMIWAVSILTGFVKQAWGLTLGIAGLWLVVHAMHWEDRAAAVLKDFWVGMRTGKITWVANVAFVLLLVLGAAQAWQSTPQADGRALQLLGFLHGFWWYLLSAFLVRTVGALLDEAVRTGRADLAHWTTGVSLIAFGFLGSVALELAIKLLEGGTVTSLFTFEFVLKLLAGLAIMVGGMLLGRYVRALVEQQSPLRVR